MRTPQRGCGFHAGATQLTAQRDRGGDRIANNALWRIVMVRLSCDQRTKTYVGRLTAEGIAKRDIIRCLDATSREVLHGLLATPPASTLTSARQGIGASRLTPGGDRRNVQPSR
ncbi:MAG: hypothetical protein WAW53_00240 [Candidatus Dormiibacterota bacterium]